MRILIVTTSYPAHEEDPSGHFVRAEARRFVRAGHEIQVIAPLDGPPQRTPDDPWLVHHVHGSALFGWPGAIARSRTNPMRLAHMLPFFIAARKRIRAVGQVDRVIGHWIIPAGVPLLVDHPAPLEVVAHGADVRLLCALPQPVRNAIVTTLLDRSTRFRFVARASLQTLCNTLPSNHAARLLDAAYVEPAAIDLPDVRHLRDVRDVRDVQLMSDDILRSNYASADGFVVAVGRLLDLKRFDLAITSAASANVPIVIIGDGPLRTQLGDVARATGAQATFLGLLPRTKTLAWIAAARVLVHPSRAEGAPTVVREARALGVPVVATASGDLEEWARDDPGIAIVEPTTKSLGAAIVTAFRSRTTTELGSVQEDVR